MFRPPCANSEWTDLFEEQLSTAHATGLEIILMDDFYFDLALTTNTKWINLIQLFDLSQLKSTPTNSSSTIIDHVYTSKSEYITESFVPHYAISVHFPVCFSRKVN